MNNNIDKTIVQLVDEWKKTDLIDMLDSGAVKEALPQFELINKFIVDIIPNNPKPSFKRYLTDQLEIREKIRKLGTEKDKTIEKLNKQIEKLVEEYGNNAREMYEQIKKL
jgi:hypothetical protein